MKLYEIAIVVLAIFASTLLSGCSEKAEANAPSESKKLEVSCVLKRSDVKWFWGEICPIDQNGYVSVGNSVTQGQKTTGCVTLQNVCTVVSP